MENGPSRNELPRNEAGEQSEDISEALVVLEQLRASRQCFSQGVTNLYKICYYVSINISGEEKDESAAR